MPLSLPVLTQDGCVGITLRMAHRLFQSWQLTPSHWKGENLFCLSLFLLPAISGIFLNFTSPVQFVSSDGYLPSHPEAHHCISECSPLPGTFSCCSSNSSYSLTGSLLCRCPASSPLHGSSTGDDSVWISHIGVVPSDVTQVTSLHNLPIIWPFMYIWKYLYKYLHSLHMHIIMS